MWLWWVTQRLISRTGGRIDVLPEVFISVANGPADVGAGEEPTTDVDVRPPSVTVSSQPSQVGVSVQVPVTVRVEQDPEVGDGQ